MIFCPLYLVKTSHRQSSPEVACHTRLEEGLKEICTTPPIPISWDKYAMLRRINDHVDTYSCGDCWKSMYWNFVSLEFDPDSP